MRKIAFYRQVNAHTKKEAEEKIRVQVAREIKVSCKPPMLFSESAGLWDCTVTHKKGGR